jgi:hypothetical protein
MRGLLADVNVQRHAAVLRRLLQTLDLWPMLVEMELAFATFGDVDLSADHDDPAVWTFFQREGWVVFSENRYEDGPDSLQATLTDSWREGLLPVLTQGIKARFERNRAYTARVASDVAELLFGIAQQQYLDQPRIYDLYPDPTIRIREPNP